MVTDASTVPLADVVEVFERQDRPGAPLTAPEVARELDCARRTAHKKLTRLAEQDVLATKKVGARGRVWWWPPSGEGPSAAADAEPSAGAAPHAEALRQLHDASRELMRAESREAVCEVAVEADRDLLEPVAWTDQGAAEYGAPPAFPVEESLVGRTFAEGSYRVYDDVTAAEGLYDPDTRVRSELILPLGSHGVLNASSPAVGAFDPVDVSAARVLAANVETALDRAARLEARRARRRELERRRDELATLNQLNALVEDTIGALVGAATREEIERTVCERLAASSFYRDAWVVERGSAAGDVVCRTAAGDAPDDPLAPGTAGTAAEPTAVETALDDDTLAVVPGSRDEQPPAWLRAAGDADDTRTALVVPLAYAETVFAALVVHAPASDGFGDREQAAFETLGRVVGFVINATNNRRLLLGTTAVELELSLRGADAWFRDAAARLDATVTVEGLVPTGGETVTQYVTVDGPETETVPADLYGTPAVDDARVLATDGDRWYLECTVAVEATGGGLGAVSAYGATVRTARASPDAGRLAVRFPTTASPRDALAVVREAFPSATLVAKRVVDRSDRTGTTIRQRVADRLTDKQRRALRAAFLAGYFDTPRRTTGRELADSLGIASSTLHQHLQAAHRKLLTTVFDELA
jgi:predicted DNA binding protein